MDKAIITGATSMIGTATIEACLTHGIKKIYAVIRPGSSNISRIPKDKRVCIVECSIDQYVKLPNLIENRCEVFYHFAWSGTNSDRNVDILDQTKNIQYTIEALRVSKLLGCGKFIASGSQAEYGRLDSDKIGTASLANPEQAYGIAKYASGKLVLQEAKRLEMDSFWVRVFSVYGKYDKSDTMVSIAITGMKEGKKVKFTEGVQKWDYLYSSDAGEAFYMIGEKSHGRKIYCLGSGKQRQIKDFICAIRDVINPNLQVGLGEIPYGENSIMNLCADISELYKDTGWKPCVTFEEGIIKTVMEGDAIGGSS